MAYVVDRPAQTLLLNQASQGLTVDQVVQVFRVEQQPSPTIVTGKVLGPAPRGLSALGWRFFQDSAYVDQGLYCPAGVRTQIPDNGLGLLMQSAGVNSQNWLKPLTGRFFPDAVGDAYLYRLNFTITPTVNNKTALFDFDIGTPNRIWNKRAYYQTGAGIPVPDSYDVATSSTLAHKTNGGAFYVTPDADVFVSKISVLAFKLFSLDPMS